MNIEKIILQNLARNDSYARKVVPFLKKEYFHDRCENVVFDLIHKFVIEYNSLPTKDVLYISLEKTKAISQDDFQNSIEIVDELYSDYNESSLDWLMNETESFCKEKAVYNAIMNSINIIDGKDSTPIR